MKFLIDMPLSPNLAAWLKNEGHEAIHAADLGLNRATDLDVMERAKAEGRTIVTADLDYPRLLALAQAAEPSLILFRHGDWSDTDTIARMRDILRSIKEPDIAQSIIVLDRDHIRKRKLPLK